MLYHEFGRWSGCGSATGLRQGIDSICQQVRAWDVVQSAVQGGHAGHEGVPGDNLVHHRAGEHQGDAGDEHCDQLLDGAAQRDLRAEMCRLERKS